MKVIAFAASNSSSSINKKLASYAASLMNAANVDIEILDLNDFEMPIFSEDREKAAGQPEQAQLFHQKIKVADALIISFAEHNGQYSAAYKNIFDWVSRIDRNIYQNKPTVMLATSPGPGGGARVLNIATSSAEIFAANLTGSLSIPNFYQVFDVENQQMTDNDVKAKLSNVVNSLLA